MFIGLDVGTSGVTAGVYDEEGKLLARSYVEMKSYYPKPGWVEQEAEDWWNCSLEACRRAVKQAKVGEIDAIAVTNQRETVVAVGNDGKPLRRAIIWQDRRCVDEVVLIEEKLGERAFDITGLKPDPYFTLPKILWIMRNEPETFAKTWKFMLVHDYIVYRLCGAVVTDWSNASRTMLMNLRSKKWSEEIASEFGLDLDKMPEIVRPGETLGKTGEEFRNAVGVSCEVVAGGGDQQCSALGQGVVEEGKVKSTTGTGTFVVAPTESFRGRTRRLIYSAHVVDCYVIEASIFTTGSLLSWLRREAYGGSGYEVINEEAEKSGIGANGLVVLPFFSGAGCPHWNPLARGAIIGLTLGHTRGDIARAIMESVAFEVRTNVELMEEEGLKIDEIRLDGGAARSRLWNEIFASVLKRRCLVSGDVEATARGAAILAASGSGRFSSLRDALKVFEPEFLEVRGGNFEKYEEAYRRYVNVRDSYTALGAGFCG
ncbi:MAG: FGGY family carbohydrate kinase [Archaeoglobaceae archaeon]